MPYCQLYYHIIWATKNREPFLNPENEPIIHNLLLRKATGLGGNVFALNGWVDHIHVVTTIPAKIAVAKFIGQIKGASSAKFNRFRSWNEPLYWQNEYAVFSFDRKRLPYFIRYVEGQKQHHKEGTTIPILERYTGTVGKTIQEIAETYIIDYDDWKEEFGIYE
jgi:REP element-mobilizing transposase RayT